MKVFLCIIGTTLFFCGIKMLSMDLYSGFIPLVLGVYLIYASFKD